MSVTARRRRRSPVPSSLSNRSIPLEPELEETFSNCTSYSFKMTAADVVGDMAYTVSLEHTQASVNGELRTYNLRTTQVYRREDGEWKVAHRHADAMPDADGSGAAGGPPRPDAVGTISARPVARDAHSAAEAGVHTSAGDA